MQIVWRRGRDLRVCRCINAQRHPLQIPPQAKQFACSSHGYFQAEREGFEPSIPCGIHAFQACALGHYATSPSPDRSDISDEIG